MKYQEITCIVDDIYAQTAVDVINSKDFVWKSEEDTVREINSKMFGERTLHPDLIPHCHRMVADVILYSLKQVQDS